MFDMILTRLRQGHRTMKYPHGPAPAMPARFAGRAVIDGSREIDPACAAVCPTGALTVGAGGCGDSLDMGKCLFCRACETCSAGAVRFTGDYRLARASRDDLIVTSGEPGAPGTETEGSHAENAESAEKKGFPMHSSAQPASHCSSSLQLSRNPQPEVIQRLGDVPKAPMTEIRPGAPGQSAIRNLVAASVLPHVRNDLAARLFSRSLKLRQVSAGGCNACEADTNVLNTIAWDLGRFGIGFVASPRHADGLLVTGPVTQNMRLALEKTYAAVPSPKIVIAVGACAIAGGPYIGHAEVCGGADAVVPVDLYIPGCPPHPMTILDGLLRFLGRIGD